MNIEDSHFELRLAHDEGDLRAAQRLRYQVFVEELGAGGDLVDHDNRLERDRFDPFFDHLLLIDRRRPEDDQTVGVYRMMRDHQARAAGQFYSEGEYDLEPLKSSGRSLMELGRSCVHSEYRGGIAMVHLWKGLSAFMTDHGVEVMFGVASLKGTDPAALAAPLSLLHHRHLAPEALRARAREAQGVAMDMIAEDDLDAPAAMRAVPALIKAYLRIGGTVGQGAWIDRAFNCTDVCLIVDTAVISKKHRAFYAKGHG